MNKEMNERILLDNVTCNVKSLSNLNQGQHDLCCNYAVF